MRSYVLYVVTAAVGFFGTPLLAQHTHDHGAMKPAKYTDIWPEARRQLAAVERATARYKDIEVAKRDGYVRFGRSEQALMGEHWYRKDLVTAPLDLERPSTLQYAAIDGKR